MRILCLADIHIGAIKDCQYVYNTIVGIIDKELLLNKTDAVVILGDYFDRLFKGNEEYVGLAINVMSALVRACQKNHTKIRLVYGTESHECEQYHLFNYHLTSNKVDMKLITTCTEEELFPGCNVLYLPEEYISDKEEFYKDTLYSGKQYQYIFGHGIIEDGMPAVVSYGKINKAEKQVPRFKSGELAQCSKLTCYGHYHIHTDMDGNVHYIGSLFRYAFGEEKPKGYGVIVDDELQFVENDKAYIYKTYEFDKTSTIYNSNDDLVKEINDIKKENEDIFLGNKTGMIRIIFHPDSNADPAFKENVRSMLFKDKFIKPTIKDYNEALIEDVEDDVDDEYSFILSNTIPITDKIYRYINKKYENILTLEDIINYINEPLKI